jgi:hypothetical protein
MPMTIIHAQCIGEQAIVPKDDFERLLELARRSEPVVVQSADDESSTPNIMRLAETGGAFDFWKAPGEDVYSVQDGEPI